MPEYSEEFCDDSSQTGSTSADRAPASRSSAWEKVKDYPQVSLRLPADIKEPLRQLSVVRSQAQWRIICDAIDCYLRELPSNERRQMSALDRAP